jgi:HlyD family secretion protein
MPKRLLVLAAVVVAAVLFFRYVYNPAIGPRPLRASGTIEATTVDVSFQIGGRVAEILAREGEGVKAGTVLARLSSEELEARVRQIQAARDGVSGQIRQQEAALALRTGVVENHLEQARGQADAVRTALSRLNTGSRPEEIRLAEAEVAQAEAALAPRQLEYRRAGQMLDGGLISQQQFDAARAASQAAEAALAAARQRLALVREGPRREDIAEGEARLRSADAGVAAAETGRKEIDVERAGLETLRARYREIGAQLDVAKSQLGYTAVRAPIDGVVLTRNMENGEVANPGTPVATLADLDNLWMNLYVPEMEIGRLKLGRPVGIRVDAFPDERFKGTVSFISSEAEFTPKTIQTEEERIKLVYRVKVSLENTGQRLKPGMPADAEIE